MARIVIKLALERIVVLLLKLLGMARRVLFLLKLLGVARIVVLLLKVLGVARIVVLLLKLLGMARIVVLLLKLLGMARIVVHDSRCRELPAGRLKLNQLQQNLAHSRPRSSVQEGVSQAGEQKAHLAWCLLV